MEQFERDLRYALRMFLKQPAFTFAALATLALGIGLTTAIFSTVNAVLLRPLPYKDAGRLLQLWETHPAIRHAQVAYPDFLDWRHGSRALDQIAGYTFEGAQQYNLFARGDAEQVQASLVTENLLPMLGIHPVIGRQFAALDMQPGHDDAVMISDALWKRRFQADSGLIGRSIQLDGSLFRVVGILPPGEMYPAWADVLVPVSHMRPEDLSSRKHHQLEVIGRLRADSSEAQVRTELSGIANRLEREYPATNKSIGVATVPLQEQVTGSVRTPLLILLCAVGAILLIACANVANLLFARSIARRKEVALRLALGASRGRLIGQLLTESLLLSVFGGLLGVAIANEALQLLKIYAAEQLPRVAEIDIDWRVLLFTFAITVAASILCGLLPALEAVRKDQNATLKEAGRGSVSGSGRRIRQILVVGEVALALIISVSAGLLVRSFDRVLAIDLGFRADHLLTFRATPSPSKYKSAADVRQFRLRLVSKLQEMPGVKEVATVYPIPLTTELSRSRFLLEGTSAAAGSFPVAQIRGVSPNFFSLMAIGVKTGRVFTEQDALADAAPVCLASAGFSRRFLQGRAIGTKVLMGVLDPHPTAIPIVGIVDDVRGADLATEPEPVLYFPTWDGDTVLRTTVEPKSVTSAVRQAVRSIDPEQPIAKVSSMDDLVSAAVARRRFATVLLSGFSLLALALAAIGLYGLISYSVAQRTQEFGLRMALGAERGRVFRTVLIESLLLSLGGVLLGLAISVGATRFLATLLYGVKPTDPLTLLSVSAAMCAVASAAAILPARRAISIDPLLALRHE